MQAPDFFAPYINILIGAAYNIQQSIEGAGAVFSLPCPSIALQESAMVSCVSPASTLNEILGLLVLIFFIVVGMVLLASYVLKRNVGVFVAALVIALPGMLNATGFLPRIDFAPHTIYVGDTEALGRASGFAVLLFISLIAGWAAIIVSYDVFSLKGNFKNFYDHIWYAAIILTGAFFVYDVGTNKTRAELAQQNAISQKASWYLRNQAKDYFEYCERVGRQNSASCRWASEVQQTLGDYANYGPAMFVSFGPKDDLELYFPNFQEGTEMQALEIRGQVKIHNHTVCPTNSIYNGVTQHSPMSSSCQRPPADFCTVFPSPPEDFVDAHIGFRTLNIASECIVPMLVQS